MKNTAHFVANDLINPTNPISIILIGAGASGSQMVNHLANMNVALNALEHPGIHVTLYDHDLINTPNIGKQRFSTSEVGLHKSVALINRINRFFGSNWKAVTNRYDKESPVAQIIISCVDNIATRFEIAAVLKPYVDKPSFLRDSPLYWLDFGNSQKTGQVLISTISKIEQPKSKKFKTVKSLPFITDEFSKTLVASEIEDETPSCSLSEALEKQDLFINAGLTADGASLLWNMFRTGYIEYRGFFKDIGNFRSQPIPC